MLNNTGEVHMFLHKVAASKMGCSHRHTQQWALHNPTPHSRGYTTKKALEQQIYTVKDAHESCHLKSYWITSIRENCSLKKRSAEFIETNPSIFIRVFSIATKPWAVNNSPPEELDLVWVEQQIWGQGQHNYTSKLLLFTSAWMGIACTTEKSNFLSRNTKIGKWS